MMRNILSLILAVALLVTTNVHRADAVMIPQDTHSETFQKTIYNPAASSQWNLVYSFDSSPYKVYRWCGYIRSTLNSGYTLHWQIRDNYGNVIVSHSMGGGTYYYDETFPTGFDGFRIYAYVTNTSVSYTTVSSDGSPITIYYGSDVADQATAAAARDAANTASTNATNAYNAANTAATNATSALNAANNANTNASNASNRAWYSGTYGGSQQSVADVSGYIAYSQLPAMNNTLNDISTSINNYYGTDKTRPDLYLQTVSGASATSGSSIQAVMKITDPDDTTGFMYSLDNVTYSPVPANNIITLPVNNIGPNLIWVWVKDPAGNLGSDAILIRKL